LGYPPGRLALPSIPGNRAADRILVPEELYGCLRMPFVGRAGELRTLEHALAGASSKEGGVIVLSGEPGIGKTSLLRELGLRAEGQGFGGLYVRCLPHHLGNEELIWQRIWRGLSEKRLSYRSLSAASVTLQYHDPGPEESVNLESYSHVAHSESVAVLFNLILDRLEALSRGCPLLVSVDDIQYADEVSLKLLGFLADSLDCLPVLFALSYSCSDYSSCAQRDWIAEVMGGRGRGVEIGPLDENETGQMLRHVTGFTQDEWTVRFVRHLTGGNTRFIVECGAILGDLNRARPLICHNPKVRIPSVVRIAIKERLKPLTPESKRILEVAAMFPKAFDPQLISEVADFNEAETHAAIAELQSAGLIRRASDHTYDYTHGFTRELLYRELSLPRRSYLHRRIANVLEVHDPPEFHGNARDIAEHLMRVGEPYMMIRAIRHAQLAARHFASRRDFAKAAEMYSVAIDAIESQAGLDSGELCGTLIALGEAQREAGQIQAAQLTLCRAARLAQDLADKEKLVHIALGMPDLGWPFADSPNGVALILAEKSLASLTAGDSTERALLTARVAAELSYLKDQGQCRELLFAETVEMGRRMAGGNGSAMLRINYLRDHILRRPDLLDERLTNADQVIGIALKAGDNHALFVSTFAKLCVFSEMGDTASAEAEFALMEQVAILADHPAYRVVLLNLSAARALHQGRLDRVQELCREARELASISGLDGLAERYWPCLIVPMREQGRLSELAPVGDRTSGGRPCFAARALLCWLAFELGDLAQAGSYLELLATEFGDLDRRPYSLAAAALLGEVSAGLKIVQYAAVLYKFMLPFKSHYIIFEAAYTPFGSASGYLGKLALALSKYDEAVAHFEEAFELARKTGGRTWAAYSLVELAKSLLIRSRPGDRERAVELLETAGREATNLKMNLLANNISELLSGDAFSDVSLNAQWDFRCPARPAGHVAIDKKPVDTTEPSFAHALSQPSARLRREATDWEVIFEGRTVRLKKLRGLTLIAHLLSHPYQPISTLELASLGRNGEVMAERRPPSDLGPALDDDAKRAYRARVQELHQEREEARSSGNEQAALKVEEELRFLTREIARAVGLFGRDRRTGSDSERARVRVTNSIKFAIMKIAEHQPSLGSYLQRTIRTGTSCSYMPEPGADIAWEL
jgi:tetratricopeptide (TPR) repeat protein